MVDFVTHIWPIFNEIFKIFVSETMWYMELKISTSDKHHRHSKCTKFCQNLRGILTILQWLGMEWPKSDMIPLPCYVVHWELTKRGGFEVSNRWWEHCPSPALCNDSVKLLWDFTTQTDWRLLHNWPDIACIGFVMNHTASWLTLLYQETAEFC